MMDSSAWDRQGRDTREDATAPTELRHHFAAEGNRKNARLADVEPGYGTAVLVMVAKVPATLASGRRTRAGAMDLVGALIREIA